MAGGVTPSRWAVEQFGEHAVEVMRHVVTGLVRGQRAARSVQATAKTEGATNNHPYGSMWDSRYDFVVKPFELADLPGYEAHKPKGASYSLAVVNGRVLIPFRHATSLNVPIKQAKLNNKIPRKVSRDNGVEPAPTLFDITDVADATDGPTVADAAEAARAEKLTVIYVAYVANADSDVQKAWWGTPISLEDDGTLVWSPEELDMSLGTVQTSGERSHDNLRLSGADVDAPGFAQGDMPQLDVTPRSEPVERPSAEPEPTTPHAEDGDE